MSDTISRQAFITGHSICVTIPREIRKKYGISAGTKITYRLLPDGILISKEDEDKNVH